MQVVAFRANLVLRNINPISIRIRDLACVSATASLSEAEYASKVWLPWQNYRLVMMYEM